MLFFVETEDPDAEAWIWGARETLAPTLHTSLTCIVSFPDIRRGTRLIHIVHAVSSSSTSGSNQCGVSATITLQVSMGDGQM